MSYVPMGQHKATAAKSRMFKSLPEVHADLGGIFPFKVSYDAHDGGPVLFFHIYSYDASGALDCEWAQAGEVFSPRQIVYLGTVGGDHWRAHQAPAPSQVDKNVAACSCNIVSLMAQGCTCGSITRYAGGL